MYADCVVIGGGLTGLTTAYRLRQKGVNFCLIEHSERLGGQIQTFRRDGFVYEAGPSTGLVSKTEVVDLFDELGGDSLVQYARPVAQRRLIGYKGRFCPLPSGLMSAIATPLFSWRDKFRILGEPWRKAGQDPYETIASVVRRRLGQSFYTYAIDPFIGGIYAGDAEALVTRYALPRLYALEQEWGSWVRGACAKMCQGKTEAERRVDKRIYSCYGGLSAMIDALVERIGSEHVLLSTTIKEVQRLPNGMWQLTLLKRGEQVQMQCRSLISTIAPQALVTMLGEVLPSGLSAPLISMRHAPVVQVAVGYKAIDLDFEAFGALIPRIEDAQVLGILNPSAGFESRAPEGGVLLSVFLGGMRAPRFIEQSDEAVRTFVIKSLDKWLGIQQIPDLLHIFRHQQAIPQYERSTGERIEAIAQLEAECMGLFVGGNMLDGIGMPDRIAQGYRLAERVVTYLTD